MTAVNVIVCPDAVHLVTDGAAVDREGRLATIAMKVIPLPHMLVALAYSGPANFLSAMADLAGSCGASYDDLRDGLAAHTDRISGAAINQHGLAFQVVVAGWSLRSRRPEAFTFNTHGNGAPAYTAAGIELAQVMPGCPDGRIEAEIFPVIEAGGFDIEKVAGDLVEIQRTIPADCALAMGGGGAVSPNVGVWAQLTTVTRNDVRTRIVRRWPQDVIGQPLGRTTIPFNLLSPAQRGFPTARFG